jgi:hypothetical protein
MDFVTYTTPLEKRFIITANISTPYMVSTINMKLAGGLVMLTVPKGPTGGIINDLQMRNISDTGLAGPDKGQGGKYLIIGPEAHAPENHGADYVVFFQDKQDMAGHAIISA